MGIVRVEEPRGATQVRTDHRWGLGAFVAVEAMFLVSSAFLMALFDPDGADDRMSPVGLVLRLMLPIVLAAALAVAITMIRGNGPVLDLNLRLRRSDLSWGVAIGLPALGLTIMASSLWTRLAGEDAKSSLGSVLSLVRDLNLPIPLAVLIFLHIWLIAPVCEEIIFRGLLWGAMERLRWGRWAAFTLTTAIFAISHLEPDRTALLLFISTPIGLARVVTGGLGASIVTHQINNFLPALGVLLVALGVLVP